MACTVPVVSRGQTQVYRCCVSHPTATVAGLITTFTSAPLSIPFHLPCFAGNHHSQSETIHFVTMALGETETFFYFLFIIFFWGGGSISWNTSPHKFH